MVQPEFDNRFSDDEKDLIKLEIQRLWDKYRNQGITKVAAMEKELEELQNQSLTTKEE